MTRGRDNQRNKCYAWERAVTGGAHYKQTMEFADAEVMVKRIWRGERGRYGLPSSVGPSVHSKHHGSANATSTHKLNFPKWALNEWVVLHEMAHRLTPDDEAHGPRFVGVLIGLVCRHFKQDSVHLLAVAKEMGLRVNVKAIGTVPAVPLYARVARYLPGNAVEIAVAMNIELGTHVNYRQVRGAALRLIRDNKAVWKGDILTKVKPPPPPAKQVRKTAVRMTVQKQAEALANEHEIEVGRDGPGLAIWVLPPEEMDESIDPYLDEHYCDDWHEALARVTAYVGILKARPTEGIPK